MSNEMKMSDVFKLPVNGACVHVNFHELIDNYNDGVTPFDAIDIAINNHDRLVEQNKRLREALHNSHAWLCIDYEYVESPLCENNAQILSELGGE